MDNFTFTYHIILLLKQTSFNPSRHVQKGTDNGLNEPKCVSCLSSEMM